jgi:Flp pilus assembly protein TadD
MSDQKKPRASSGAGGPPAARTPAAFVPRQSSAPPNPAWERLRRTSSAGVSPAARSSGAGVSPAVVARPAGVDDPLRSYGPEAAGHLAYDKGSLEESLARFQAAISSNPLDAESMSNAAQILVRLGRTE